MRHGRILQKLTAQYQRNIHQSHITFLAVAINSLCGGRFLGCVSLGRGLNTSTTTKHNIKRVDYMLSSSCLHSERIYFYCALALSLIPSHSRPLILVDWSSTTPCRKFHILRASVVVEKSGRAMTIYEENHPESKLGSAKVHANFISQLKTIVPQDCHPIIMTDAGYKVPWFRLISKQGWDYIGRVRGSTHSQLLDKNSEFVPCKTLYAEAKTTPTSLGHLKLTKKHQWKCVGYLAKQRPKGRKKKNVMGSLDKSTAGRKNAKRAREPWLLVSSIKGAAKKIINCYKKRMQIEESFRDMKSHRYGMGLKLSRTRSAKRFDILLLIASLAHFILYLMGRSAEEKALERTLQTNSIKTKRQLSYVFVGKELWKTRYRQTLLKQCLPVLKLAKMEVANVYNSL